MQTGHTSPKKRKNKSKNITKSEKQENRRKRLGKTEGIETERQSKKSDQF